MRGVWAGGFGAALALLGAGAGRAEEPGDQELIVLGERAARSLKNTSASVDVITAEDLDRLSTPDRIEQVLAFTPNVQLGAGDQLPSIRGQDSTGVLLGADAFLGGARPRATLSVDGRALGLNEFVYGLASVWDVRQIEVFRGPQTTTQGRNSIAGAIFVETAEPTFEAEGRARFLFSDYRTRQGSLALSGPLLGDQVAGRVALDVRRHDSWVRYSGDDGIPGADRMEDDYILGRGKLLIKPDALPALRVELTFQHLESRGPQAEAVFAPFAERRYDAPGGGYWRTRVDSFSAQSTYAVSTALDLDITVTYGDSTIERLTTPGFGVGRVNASDVSLETILRYRPAPGARFEGLAGFYGVRAAQDERLDLSIFLGDGAFRDEQLSLGFFGEGTWRPLPRLALTAGARYQRDAQDRSGALGPFLLDYDEAFSAFLPKASLAYDLSDRWRIGVLAQRGFNAGGTTISFTTGEQDV
ncbi:MAG: TonB-dependent receptor, partial [Hyphomonadaceae bacterium]|nr:TonB-dependent receptor [Hyphomonadaceae bacterium]